MPDSTPPSRDDAPDAGIGRAGDPDQVRRDLRDMRARLWIFGQVLLGGVIDAVFIGLWVVLQRVAHMCFDAIDATGGITHVERQIMEVMFDGATMSLVAAFVLRDLYLSVRRIWGFR